MPRVTFVHVENPTFVVFDTFGVKPVWAFTLGSYLADNSELDLELFDTRLCDSKEIPEADLFMFGAIDRNFSEVERVVTELRGRYPGAKFLLGGPICWSFDQVDDLDRLSFVDHLVIGDGEEVVAGVVDSILNGKDLERVVRVNKAFALSKARPMYTPFLRDYFHDSFGAIVEVSRGCPFLCEFCDIRIRPDNNRANNKAADVVIREIEELAAMGIKSFTFACDNFIGDLRWAHELVDRLLEWEERSGNHPCIFTWLTINLYKDKDLMVKMRRAGFSLLFVGVESFSRNSLLETAKVQNNTTVDMREVLRQIQSYGFMIVAGMIIGFDSDEEDVFEVTMRGIEDSCLLITTPNMLEALPGTPLYRRMKLAGRLRNAEGRKDSWKEQLGKAKVQSNIKLLLPREKVVDGYIKFMKELIGGRHQYRCYELFYQNLNSENYVALPTSKKGGRTDGSWRALWSNRKALHLLLVRMLIFSSRPERIYYAFKGLLLTIRNRKRIQSGAEIFVNWFWSWTTIASGFTGVSRKDFDLESVDGPISKEMILPEGYDTNVFENIPASKTRAQIRSTVSQLERLVLERSR